MMNKDEHDEGHYYLSMWACLQATLEDYGITPELPPKAWEHMAQDFMELLERQGYVKYVED